MPTDRINPNYCVQVEPPPDQATSQAPIASLRSVGTAGRPCPGGD